MNDVQASVERSNELEDRIRPILAGEGPQVQGAVLACLLAAWLAGLPAELRESVIKTHADTTRKLVPLYEMMIARPLERRRGA